MSVIADRMPLLFIIFGTIRRMAVRLPSMKHARLRGVRAVSEYTVEGGIVTAAARKIAFAGAMSCRKLESLSERREPLAASLLPAQP